MRTHVAAGRGQIRAALSVFALGLLLTAAVAWRVASQHEDALRARFQERVNAAAESIKERIERYQFGLRGARGALVAMGEDNIRRPAFVRYMLSRDMALEFPGARGFGFIRRVPEARLPAFIEAARHDGLPSFDVRQLAPHDGDRYVIEYIYPDAQNRGATGLDIASDADRRRAAVEAMLSGEPRLTAPITLVQADQRAQQGFLFLMPIYRGAVVAASAAERDRQLIGWSYAPLVIDEVLAGMADRLKALDLELWDEGTGTRFYAANEAEEKSPNALQMAVSLPVFGRTWRLDARSTPAIAASVGAPRVMETWIDGVALSALAALVVFQLLHRQRQVRATLGLPDVVHDATLRNFLVSPLARGALSLYVTGVALYAGLGYRTLWDEAERSWEEDLNEVVTSRARQVERALASRRRGMEFLAATPTASAQTLGGWDRSATLDRTQAMAAAYLRGAPEVVALDMIWLRPARDARALELSDADAVDEAIGTGATPMRRLMRDAGGLLQRVDLPLSSDARDLVQQLLKRTGSTVAYSPLRKESLGGTQPAVVFKAAVISRDEADRPVAALVATVDASRRATDLALPVPSRVSLVAINDRDELLSPPLAGSTERNASQHEVDVFAAATPVPGHTRLSQVNGPREPHWSVRNTLAYNPDWPAANVTYIATVPVSAVRQAVHHELWHRLQVPLAAGVLGGALLFFYWMGLQRQLLVRAQHLHQAALLDQTHDAFIALDPDGRVLSWNKAAEQLFGKTARQALGQTLLSVAPIEAPWPTDLDLGQEVQFTTALLASGASPSTSGASPPSDRSGAHEAMAEPTSNESTPRWLSVHCLRMDAVGPWGTDVIVIVRDVSAEREVRHRLEALNDELEREVQARTQDLTQERQRLYNIIEGTAVGTWEWQVQSGQVLCNDRWATMLGVPLAELAPMTMARWRERLHPQDLPLFDLALERHLHRRDPVFSCEIRMRHQQGHWVWIQSLGRVMSWTDDGAPEWMVGLHQDISMIKTALEELASTASLLQGVLRAATEVSIIATDEQGTITVFNSGAERLLGYRAEEVVGRHTPALVHVKAEVDARAEELSREIGRPMNGFSALVRIPQLLGSEMREWTYVRKDGSRFPVSLVVTTQRDAEGRLLGYLGIAQDITARREADQALLQARDNAEAASRAKSSFLANMSHELRTPMNAVLGIAHLLNRTALNEAQRRLLGKLETAGKALLGIINDVLDLAKIEAGGLQVEWAAVQPRAVLAELGDLLEAQAGPKGLQILTDCADDVPDEIASDPLRLRQILLNLGGNAVKFTGSGSVRVSVRRERPSTGPALVWTVADTGIGISEEARLRLFQPFVQADISTTRRYGGTGLGLSIVRELTGLLGGTIQVSSTPGEGSCFTLTLPEHELPDERPAGDLHILLLGPVDDHQAEIRRLCQRMGWSTQIAHQPAALPQHVPVDVVIAQAPVLEALPASEAAERLADVPAIRVDADGLGEDTQSTADLDGHGDPTRSTPRSGTPPVLRPPISASRLFNAVAAALAPRQDYERLLRGTRIEEVDVQWLRGLRILVVDDSDINLEIARSLLEREGAVVETAGDGREALTRLGSAAEPTVDAVLMDVQMPVMDGLQACRVLRQEMKLALPVIALTAGAMDDERERALEAGMTDFLSKPLDPAAVVRSLRLHIDRAASEAVTDRMAAASHALDSPVDQQEA